MNQSLEGRWIWVAIVVASAGGAVLFGLRSDWAGFILFAVSALLATAQLVRILMRARAGGSGGRRW